MEVRFWAATDDGLTRDHNEDNFLVDKKLNLFIVADGMGGHAAGEVASSVAVREVRRVVAENRTVIQRYGQTEGAETRQEVLKVIEKSIVEACARIYELAQESPERRGMGTTCSMMLVAGRRGFIGHVGDSRIYMVRTNRVHQLTEDHSLVNELIRRGRLKPGDVFDSPYKNAVTRAVGVYESVEVDAFDFDIAPGDNFLLCSDGLSCYIDDDITREYLSAEDIRSVPDRFIRLANQCGGKDNITAIVVRLSLDAAEAGKAQPEAREQRVAPSDTRQRVEVLRAVPLFKYLAYKDLIRILAAAETRSYRPGTTIFAEGAQHDTFYVIIDGQVRLEKGDKTLVEKGRGDHFGEAAMIDNSPALVSAIAAGRVDALVIERQAFFDALRHDAIVAVKVLWSIVQMQTDRLQIARREMLLAHDIVERLGRDLPAGTMVEQPLPDPTLSTVATLPVASTNELMPGFLFDSADAESTDPMLRVESDKGSKKGEGSARPAKENPEATSSERGATGSRSAEIFNDLSATTDMDVFRSPTIPDDYAPGLGASKSDPDRAATRRNEGLPALKAPKDSKGRTTAKMRRPSGSGRSSSD